MARVENSGRWYLWDGGFLAFGRSEGIVPEHAHHAIQIGIAFEGAASIRPEGGEWQSGRGVIVKPDAVHSYNGQGIEGVMLFVDPESSEGIWLRSSLAQDITFIPDARLAPCISELRTFFERPFEGMEIGALIRHCVHSLCTGAPPARKPDPRITNVLRAIRASEDLQISLESAAATVFLSPSRFTHLFKQQVGLPFRRYILWRKLARALVAIGREGTIAAAAHAAGFADAAHLTRTSNEMFGIPPSAMMRGEFFEIPSPFDPVIAEP